LTRFARFEGMQNTGNFCAKANEHGATSAIVREVHEKCHANPKITAKILGFRP